MISPYHPQNDLSAVAALWQAALGDTWPLTETLIANVIANPVQQQGGAHFVAREGDQIVGFVATQINPNPDRPPGGCILALMVHPAYQRRGIGETLHDTAVEYLKGQGVSAIQAGGKYPRVWPGIPDNLPGALEFFKTLGWEFSKVDNDLGRDLIDYATPPELDARMAAEGVQLGAGTAADVDEVLAFNDREFPGWADTYHYVASLGDYADFLVARDLQKGVVGSLIMYGPTSNPKRVDALWKPQLGDNIGGVGEVGVAASERGRGIGLGIVAVGSEVLKARGVRHSNIGFTTLVDFYGKLGYKVWHRYNVAWRIF